MADAIDVHERLSWHEQLQALDAAIYAAVAATPTPTFDRALGFTTASREPLWAVDRRRGRSRHDRRSARTPRRCERDRLTGGRQR
jgi:hypothetical protein